MNTLHDTPGNRRCAARMRAFLDICAGSAPYEEAERVREAALLLGGLAGATAFDRNRIEGMLENGAALSAVLEIAGGESRLMLSRGGDGSCLATVVSPDGAGEVTAEGATLALALLAAHMLTALARIERGSTVADVPSVPPSLRLH